jgi:tetratricopeptide (TPR) repeat protein
MGIAYYKLKEYQAAIDAFEKAIKIKPDAYENYNSVGAAYIKTLASSSYFFAFFECISISAAVLSAFSRIPSRTLILESITKNPYTPDSTKMTPIAPSHQLIKLPWLFKTSCLKSWYIKVFFTFSCLMASNCCDYKTPFNTGDKFPMGEAPILVEKITINTYENGNIVFIFESTHEKDMRLNLNLQILHNLSDLLARVMPITEWNITTD